MARRKIGRSHTTICITWEDKDEFRKFAKFIKKTKNGEMYESDAVIFNRMLKNFIQNGEQGESHRTYPTKDSTSPPTHDQQG